MLSLGMNQTLRIDIEIINAPQNCGSLVSLFSSKLRKCDSPEPKVFTIIFSEISAFAQANQIISRASSTPFMFLEPILRFKSWKVHIPRSRNPPAEKSFYAYKSVIKCSQLSLVENWGVHIRMDARGI